MNKGLMIACFLVMFCIPAVAERKGTFGFGIQAGSSLGFRPEFGLYTIENDKIQPFIYGLRLYHDFCGHIQYSFSDRFGVRFDLAYQKGTYIEPRLNRLTNQWRLVTRGSSFSYFTLNGVYAFQEGKHVGFFLQAGAGSGSGEDWIHGPDGFMVFTGGTGANIYLIPNSDWAVIAGLLFHHLYDPTNSYRSSTIHGSWISLNIGIGYAPRKSASGASGDGR